MRPVPGQDQRGHWRSGLGGDHRGLDRRWLAVYMMTMITCVAQPWWPCATPPPRWPMSWSAWRPWSGGSPSPSPPSCTATASGSTTSASDGAPATSNILLCMISKWNKDFHCTVIYFRIALSEPHHSWTNTLKTFPWSNKLISREDKRFFMDASAFKTFSQSFNLALFQFCTLSILHSSNLTLFQYYTLSILHSSKLALFQSCTLPILHSSNLTLFQSYVHSSNLALF